MIIFFLITLTIIVLIALNTIANKINQCKVLQYISNIEPIGTNDDLRIETGYDGFYTVITDRDLKIVQLTDIHIGGGWKSRKTDLKALNAVATMIQTEKPDLVITTGDISFPSPFRAGTFNNQYAATFYASLMTQLDVYWVVTLGNHDSESHSRFNRRSMADFYSQNKWGKSLFNSGDKTIKGYGNSIIRISNSDGILTQVLFTIDSNEYVKKRGGGYANIHQSQIDWYRKICNRLNIENDDLSIVKSLVFMHIPPIEYKKAWDEFKDNGYQDTENVKYHYGTLGESVCHPKENDKFFESIIECGSTQGIFVGHDHVNTFSLDYKGVRLTYGMSIDYAAYIGIDRKGTQRGCTIITVKPDGTFNCYPENYYQDKYKNPHKETVTMQQLNEEFN